MASSRNIIAGDGTKCPDSGERRMYKYRRLQKKFAAVAGCQAMTSTYSCVLMYTAGIFSVYFSV